MIVNSRETGDILAVFFARDPLSGGVSGNSVRSIAFIVAVPRAKLLIAKLDIGGNTLASGYSKTGDKSGVGVRPVNAIRGPESPSIAK